MRSTAPMRSPSPLPEIKSRGLRYFSDDQTKAYIDFRLSTIAPVGDLFLMNNYVRTYVRIYCMVLAVLNQENPHHTLYVGMPGFNTVLKPGVFSLTQDERDKGFIAENWIDMFLRKRISTFAAIRQVAQNVGHFLSPS